MSRPSAALPCHAPRLQVNSYVDNEELAMARENRLAQAVDGKPASALLFPGHAALSGLYDFLLNHRWRP